MIHGVLVLITALYAYLLFLDVPMKQGVFVGIVLFVIGLLVLWYTQSIKHHLTVHTLKKIIGLSVVMHIAFAFVTFGHNDVFRYVWDGRVILEGFNPYFFTPNTLSHMQVFDMPWYWDHLFFKWSVSSYPPFLQAVFTLSNLIARDSIIALKLIFTAFNVGTLYLLYSLISKEQRYWLVFIALSPLFIYETIGAGHTESVFMFLLVLSLWLNKRGKLVSTGMALAGLVLTKFVPLLIVPFFLKRKNWLYIALSGIVMGGMLSVPFLVKFPVSELLSSLQLYVQEWVMSPGLFHVTQEIVGDAYIAKYVLLIIGLVLILVMWRNRTYSLETKSFIVLLWILLSSAAVFSWYWLWVLPLIPFVSVGLRNIALAGILMFPLQSLIVYFDVADNTIKYTNNGVILWHQLLLWLPLVVVTIFYVYSYVVRYVALKKTYQQ